MRNKGFTLIELLAVIVILAITALVATPIVINIINDSREEANKRSIESYAEAVKNAIARNQLATLEAKAGVLDDKILSKIEYSGSKVNCDSVILEESGEIKLNGCKVGNSDSVYLYSTMSGNMISEPGIYDSNYNLLATWNELVNTYGFDISNYGNHVVLNYYFSEGTTLIIKDNVTTIGASALENCTSLTTVIIPDSVTSIETSAFAGCRNLKSITIGSGVTSIGEIAFSNCDSLASATFNETSGWRAGSTNLSSTDLSNDLKAATYLKSTYTNYLWTKS